MSYLIEVEISRFKSIKSARLRFSARNVLIGPNGGGKSNLISFFRMLAAMTNGGFQHFVGIEGGASSLLHFGPKESPILAGEVTFDTTKGLVVFDFKLAHAADDSFIFVDEGLTYPMNEPPATCVLRFGAGHRESRTSHDSAAGEPQTEAFSALRRFKVFHFHDTSRSARVRNFCDIDSARELDADGGNLAAMLYRLREVAQTRPYYERIVRHAQLLAPFFDTFVLHPSPLNPEKIQLRWRVKGRPIDFGPHQLSDGSLRAILLITLLSLPENELPALIVLDEPELGLHPYAISIIASLIRSLPLSTRVLVATQSVEFLNEFDPEDVVITELHEGETSFKRLEQEQLTEWLSEYSLGELWEKNVIGGRPSR